MSKAAGMLLGSLAILAIFIVPAAYAQQAGDSAAAITPAITSPASNAVISSNTVMITGTSAPSEAVVIFDSTATPLGNTQASSDGEWSLELTLADGTHTIVAVTRPDLSTFLRSDPVTITVSGGSTTVHEFAITSPPFGTVMRDDTITVMGTSPPGQVIHLYDASTFFLASAVADNSGEWSADIQLEDEGMHFVVAITSQDSETISNVIDNVCVASPAQCSLALRESFLGFDRILLYSFQGGDPDYIWPEVTSPISGTTLYENNFVMTGISEPNSLITIYDAFLRSIGSTTANSGGVWSVPVEEHAGAHIYAIIASKEGIPNLHALTFFNIDTPYDPDHPLPQITSPTYGDLITDGRNIPVTGTADPNSVIVIVDLNYLPLATTITSSTGDWSATVNLKDGTAALVATEITNGVATAHSAFVALHVDSGMLSLDRPVITSHGAFVSEQNRAVTISGTAAPNSMISIVNHAAELAATMSDGAGAWSVTTTLPDGLYTISAIASMGDTARSGPSAPVTMFVNADDSRQKICR